MELVKEMRVAFKDNKPLGMNRVVPIGSTQNFSLNWDGYDLINQVTGS